MNGAFRQSMAWLHTWSGLVVGWMLFTIFLTGTAAFFQDEISVWMRPELSRGYDPIEALDLASERLRLLAPEAESWTIVGPDERDHSTRISWQPKPSVEGTLSGGTIDALSYRATLDSNTGLPLDVRETRGGDLFYRLHYRFEQPGRTGWWFSGAAAVAMLVALVTGVIIHKRIFKDFFTFRPASSQQRSWLDAHNILAVLALPFHFMITYTGLVPLMSTIVPGAVIANYAPEFPGLGAGFDYPELRDEYSRDRGRTSLHAEASGRYAPLTDLRPLLERAQARWQGGRIERVNVSNAGDARAVVEIRRHVGDQISYRPESLFFAGASGRFLGIAERQDAVEATRTVMYGLHIARFADPSLRWLLFFLGVLSTLMIATGLVLWTVKRRPKVKERASVGHAFVSRLNVGVIAGLPIGIAAFFWANRLLPLGLAERAAAEVRVFFAVWALSVAYAALRPLSRAWTDELTVAAAAYAALPLLNALTTPRGLHVSLAEGDWIMAGFDLACAGVGVLFGCTTWITRRGSVVRQSA